MKLSRIYPFSFHLRKKRGILDGGRALGIVIDLVGEFGKEIKTFTEESEI